MSSKIWKCHGPCPIIIMIITIVISDDSGKVLIDE